MHQRGQLAASVGTIALQLLRGIPAVAMLSLHALTALELGM